MSKIEFGSQKVAAIHAAPIFGKLDESIEKAASFLDEAGRAGCSLAVFPEAFLPGFPYWINVTAPIFQSEHYVELWSNSVDLDDLSSLHPIVEVASRHELTAVIGANGRTGGTIYNTQIIVDGSRGVVEVRRKLIPTFAERTVWGMGDASTLGVLDTGAGPLSALMCWEHTMHIVKQVLVADGARVHAAAWPALASLQGVGDEFVERVNLLIRHHALTCQSFVVSAMGSCTPDVIESISSLPGAGDLMKPGPGWSAIVHPSGRILAQTSEMHDEVLVAEIDLRDTVKSNHMLDLSGHYSRPDLFQLVVDSSHRTGMSRTSGPVAEEDLHGAPREGHGAIPADGSGVDV